MCGRYLAYHFFEIAHVLPSCVYVHPVLSRTGFVLNTAKFSECLVLSEDVRIKTQVTKIPWKRPIFKPFQFLGKEKP